MSDEQKPLVESERKPDRFTQLMFGQFPSQRLDLKNQQQASQEFTKNPPSEIDLGKIMNQIDEIMSSINQLKPMIKQISPLFNFFKK